MKNKSQLKRLTKQKLAISQQLSIGLCYFASIYKSSWAPKFKTKTM